MRTITALLSALVVLGCPPKPFVEFEPVEGPWTLTLDAIDDGCEMDWEDSFDIGTTESFTLPLDNDGSGFTFTPETDDYLPTGVCTLDGRDFTCEFADFTNEAVDFSSDGLDAIVTPVWDIGGTFTNDSQGSFVIGLNLTCEGADCWDGLWTTFPCTSTVTHDIVAD